MTSETPHTNDKPTPPVALVGSKSIGGLVWLLGDTAATKLLAFAANAVLAHLLVPEQFGLFAAALAIMTLCELTSRAGLRDILITRSSELDRLSTTSTWFAASAGMLSSLLVCSIGIGLLLLGKSETGMMVVTISPSPLITAFAIVPESTLAAHMRFKQLALIQIARGLSRAVLAVALVWGGMGTSGLIVALLASALIGTALAWMLSPVRLDRRPSGAVMRELAPSMSWLFGAGLLATVGSQADYLILGAIGGEEQLGLYFIAFSLGNQIILIFAMNMGRVLLPAMSMLSGAPERQAQGLIDACSALALLGGLVCALQAALAGPFIQGLLRPIYEPASLAMTVLACGMFFRLMSFTVVPYIKATKRFRTLFWLQAGLVTNLLALAALGSWLGRTSSFGAASGCATGVAVASFITGIVAPVVALRGSGKPPQAIASVLIGPILCGVLAGVAAWSPSLFLQDSRVGALTHLALGGTVGVCVYALLAVACMPHRVANTLSRLAPITGRVPHAKPLADAVIRRLSRTNTQQHIAHPPTGHSATDKNEA